MGKVYGVSDLHGQYDLFKMIKEYMSEEDVCYVLGDCVDRGPGSIKILVDIMADKRFKMVLGNHEAMMIEALQDAEEGYMDFQLWYMNGGQETHMELMEYDRPAQLAIMSFCKKLPIRLDYKDLILTHAGFDWSDVDPDEDTLLWDRSHIESKTPSPEGKTQIHGHTPVPDIKKGCWTPIRYSDHKICIDTGACFSKKVSIIDLDTLEVIVFDGGK